MYIGPWQEYRLAKIQDDAIQRLRREWEDQLRVEMPEGDDARTRELMQPLVAKLPALLLSAKPSMSTKRRGSVSGETAARSRASTRPASASLTDSHRTHTRRSERSDEPAESNSSGDGRAKPSKPSSNQDTHDGASAGSDKPLLAPRAPTQKKPKKPSSAPLTALEQVQKRKKMFATWIKRASNGTDGSNNTPDASARPGESSASPQTDGGSTDDDVGYGVRLPSLSPGRANPGTTRSLQPGSEHAPGRSSQTQLPPIAHPSSSADWDLVYESIVRGDLTSSAPASESSTTEGTATASVPLADTAECDLDDSLDEEEVNSFLNWTDTLACPNDLDDSALFDQ